MSEFTKAGGLVVCKCCGKTIPVGYVCCPEYLKLEAKVQELRNELINVKIQRDFYAERVGMMSERLKQVRDSIKVYKEMRKLEVELRKRNDIARCGVPLVDVSMIVDLEGEEIRLMKELTKDIGE